MRMLVESECPIETGVARPGNRGVAVECGWDQQDKVV